jgi:hypothetical protein
MKWKFLSIYHSDIVDFILDLNLEPRVIMKSWFAGSLIAEVQVYIY